MFLQTILIPTCTLSSPAFLMMDSACKLNKQGNNIQPWCTPFPIWNQSLFHVQFQLLFPDLHTDFSGSRSGDLLFPSLKEFSTVYCIHTVKGFGIVNKAPGASMRNSAHGKGHEEGGFGIRKGGIKPQEAPCSRASAPKTRVCQLYFFMLSPIPLTLRGADPHYLSRRRS